MNLLEIQASFRTWLRHGEAGAPARFPERAQPGLYVYQNNYRAQLMACLSQAFPATRQWLGENAFDEAAIGHIEQSPPFSWTLDAYPGHFPPALASLYPGDPEVGELAALELALDEAFVAEDRAPVEAAMLSSVDWDRAGLTLSPSLSIHRAHSNAGEIWTALRNGEMPPAAERLTRSAWLLVWRIGERAQFRLADSAEGDALLELRDGKKFGRVCQKLLSAKGELEAIELAAKWLGHWIADQLIVAVCLAEELVTPTGLEPVFSP